MATFEKDTWLWTPDPDECFLPAKVGAPFQQGSAGKVTLENGQTKELTAAESADCQQMDEESLGELSNMVHFNDLKEAVLLHNLRKRFMRDEIYTSVGSILVAVNPFKLLPIYTPDVLKSYVGGGAEKQPPHCWSVAAAAYLRMVSERTSQAVCISGESGAGKTESMKLILQYLAEASQKAAGAGIGEGQSIEQLILQANPVTEGFGNAKTLRNNNSSRFGKWTALTFSNQGCITGG
jgi:myosin heavy subunit